MTEEQKRVLGEIMAIADRLQNKDEVLLETAKFLLDMRDDAYLILTSRQGVPGALTLNLIGNMMNPASALHTAASAFRKGDSNARN